MTIANQVVKAAACCRTLALFLFNRQKTGDNLSEIWFDVNAWIKSR
jgi:hypothetical protein